MATTTRDGAMLAAVCRNNPSRCKLAASKEVQRHPRADWHCSECNFGPIVPAARAAWRLPVLAGVGVLALALAGAAVVGLRAPSPAACADRAGASALPPDTALAMAEDCLASGRKNEAVSLLVDLRRRGNAAAIYAMGRLYDPHDLAPGRPRQLEPSLINAVEFYRQACGLNHPQAASALEGLRPAVKAEAERGERVATDLLENWPRCG
ncbi:hypothetical protein [Belnapia rosea]|uniref:Uncharacterized protein n=1 Tax=Belnapia rosea TaxID=938405 RepID=A0A1G6S5R7_9PROT|nr:hypothetical protein [Belnapia rosea]SDD11487.1 hypothetical protein SAMN04487779_1004264 [Belnapia rosea]